MVCRSPWHWVVAAIASCLLNSETAIACSIVVDPMRTYGQHYREVRDYIARADAIIDGEVVSPVIPGKQKALVYAHHTLKGGAGRWYEVDELDSCSIPLDRKGERARMILQRVNGIWSLFFDQSDARMEDRILKSDRRKVWPYFPGTP